MAVESLIAVDQRDRRDFEVDHNLSQRARDFKHRAHLFVRVDRFTTAVVTEHIWNL